MDRKAALNYAERFWDRPCDDGEIMLDERAIRVREERTRLNAPENDGWEARFVYNGKPPSDPDFGDEAVFIKKLPAGDPGGVNIPDLPGTWLKKTIQDWAGLNDCAHYLSCCLGKNGGKAGVPEREKPDALIKELQALSGTKTLVEKVSKDAGQRVIESGIFQPGDFIGYFNTGANGGRIEYEHSAMYVGDQQITAHSVSRFKNLGHWGGTNTWHLNKGDHDLFTLIHFTDGDPTPSPDTVKWLAGWWEVKMGGGPSRFYLFQRNGTVQRTNTKPKSNSAPIAHPEDIGYWFEKHFEVIYFWRKTGIEERLVMRDWSDLFALALGNANYLMRDAFDVIVDGVPGTSATKM